MPTVDVRELDAAPPGPRAARHRILAATLRCLGRWGLAKTTVDDVAREAGVGRATLYRLFPGGREALLDALVESETATFCGRLDDHLATATSLEDVLVTGIVEAGAVLTGHVALQFLLTNEPEAILPHLAFGRFDALLRRAAEHAGPLLAPWLPASDGSATRDERAARAVEWIVRIVVSYALAPSPDVDLRDAESVRHLVRTYVLPGLVPYAARSTT
jgi:AcrR family transcriptional regulator